MTDDCSAGHTDTFDDVHDVMVQPIYRNYDFTGVLTQTAL